MGNPCRINLCGNLDQDKNNGVCAECEARYLYYQGKDYRMEDIPARIAHEVERQTKKEANNMSQRKKQKSLCKNSASGCQRMEVTKGFCRPCYQKDRYWSLKKKAGIEKRKQLKSHQKSPDRKPGRSKKVVPLKPNETFISEDTIVEAILNLARINHMPIERLAIIILGKALGRGADAPRS